VPYQPLPTGSSDDPVPVTGSLDRVVRRLGGPSAAAVGGLFERWEDIVGEQIAAHTRPSSLRDGTLVVTVDDPAWATQLRFLESDLLARVRAALDGVEVASVTVRVRRPKS
jgi:predicted nucleic acid-binding Zn ribbon protein